MGSFFAKEVATELATEAVDKNWTVPEGFDMTATISAGKIVAAVLGLIAVLAAMIVIISYVRKKQKGNMFGLFCGVLVYIIFYYYATSMIASFAFYIPPLNRYVVEMADGTRRIGNTPLYIIICSLIYGTIPILARMLTTRAFAPRFQKFCDTLQIGLGIVIAHAVRLVANLFLTVVNYYTINKVGIEELFSGVETQENFDALAGTITDMLNYKTSSLIFVAVFGILVMVYQIFISVPLFAAYQKRISKWWYAFALGTSVLFEAFGYLALRNVISEEIKAILLIVLTAVTVYFCIKLYKQAKYNEEETVPEDKFNRFNKNAPKKPMPKFDNLSNL